MAGLAARIDTRTDGTATERVQDHRIRAGTQDDQHMNAKTPYELDLACHQASQPGRHVDVPTFKTGDRVKLKKPPGLRGAISGTVGDCEAKGRTMVFWDQLLSVYLITGPGLGHGESSVESNDLELMTDAEHRASIAAAAAQAGVSEQDWPDHMRAYLDKQGPRIITDETREIIHKALQT